MKKAISAGCIAAMLSAFAAACWEEDEITCIVESGGLASNYTTRGPARAVLTNLSKYPISEGTPVQITLSGFSGGGTRPELVSLEHPIYPIGNKEGRDGFYITPEIFEGDWNKCRAKQWDVKGGE